jgi:hypothetical protein
VREGDSKSDLSHYEPHMSIRVARPVSKFKAILAFLLQMILVQDCVSGTFRDCSDDLNSPSTCSEVIGEYC